MLKPVVAQGFVRNEINGFHGFHNMIKCEMFQTDMFHVCFILVGELYSD